MKKLLIMITILLMAANVKAQEVLILGDNHAMLKLDQGRKYLLLPVQEKEENAAIAVMDGRNEMVKRLNVRLAVDKVDYFVPVELKDAKLFEITFHGDRRTKGAIKDFACWKEMKYSDSFDTTNREHFRPL